MSGIITGIPSHNSNVTLLTNFTMVSPESFGTLAGISVFVKIWQTTCILNTGVCRARILESKRTRNNVFLLYQNRYLFMTTFHGGHFSL